MSVEGDTVPIKVSCSWTPVNEKSVEDAVTTVPLSAAKRDEDGSLTDMVELDSCVLLVQPGEENGNNETDIQPCVVTLTIEPPFVITNVVVVCEAKMVEVFGASNEYLMTVPTELLDEVDGTAVYCADIKLTQSSEECALKFARLSRPSDMWLYGVKVIWNMEDVLRTNPSHNVGLNLESVEQRLKESHTQLSDRAESCKRFLKMYSSMGQEKRLLKGTGFPDPASLLSLLPLLSKQQPKSANFQESSIYSSAPQRCNSASGASGDGQPQNTSFCESCSHKFESVLETQLMSMERRIIQALDQKIVAMQHHQDKQIQNLIHHFKNMVPTTERFSDNVERTGTDPESTIDQDQKIEQAIRKMMEQRNGSFSNKEVRGRRKQCEDSKDSTLKINSFMALQLNGTSCQNRLDSSSTPVVQNSS